VKAEDFPPFLKVALRVPGLCLGNGYARTMKFMTRNRNVFKIFTPLSFPASGTFLMFKKFRLEGAGAT
jgi:hypothetical protein